LCVELDRAAVNVAALSAAQATAGRLPSAMAGFLAWLAPQLDKLELAEAFAALRARASTGEGHLRTPEAIAHLALGADMALTYAVEVGACSKGEAEILYERAWRALQQIGADQGAVIEGERPTLRFLTVLLMLIDQGKAVLLDRQLGGDAGRAEVLGWIDDNSIYLIPDASFNAVLRHGREANDFFPVRQDRLRRDLVREGLAEPGEDDHRTVRARIAGRQRRVLLMRRAQVEALLGVPFPEPPAPAAGAEM
jgi:hypothetical protein